MKKILTFLLTALLAFSVGWAADLTYTWSSWSQGTLSGAPTGVTASFVTTYNGYNNQGVQLTNGNSLTLTISGFTSSHKLTGIKITYCTNKSAGAGNVSAYLGNSQIASNLSLVYSSGDGRILRDAVMNVTETVFNNDNLVLTVTATTNSLYVNSFTVSYEETGGTFVAPPTILPAGSDFLTTQEVTLSHSDADAIYYTLDGTDPTTSSTQYTAPFTINATTTVKAIAVKDGVTSTVATATFNKTGVATIAEALDVSQGSTFTFTGNAVVTYQNGRYVWIRDNSGSGLIYRGSSDTGTFNNGDILDAYWTATNTTYNSIPEFTNPTGVTSSSNDGAAAPFDKTSTGITSANVNEYVSFSNITLSWDSSIGYCYVAYGNNKVYFKNTFFNYNSTGLSVTSGNTYNIEGIAYVQSGNVFVYMTKVTAVSPILTATPNPLTFNDSGTGNTFTVTGSNLGSDNVGLTQDGSYFTPTLTATVGSTYSYDNGTYRGFTPANGSVNGTVAMSYSGRELSASETVTLANNLASTTVTVNYRADLYIVGDYGSGWDFSTGTPMTYDNGTYTASITVDAGNLILFARRLGSDLYFNDSSPLRELFGPNSNGDWWVNNNPSTGSIDLNDDDPIYFPIAGTYTIEINASTGALTVTREVVNTGDFELVTDINDLDAGDEVIFVNTGTAGSAYAMSTTQASSNRPGTAVTVTNGLKVTATDATQIFTLEGSSSGWYFHTVNGDNQGYIYAASSSGNQLKTETTADNNAKATISIANGGAATIIFQGSNTRNYMRYNPNNDSPIFACYSSSSTTGNLAYIYKRLASTEPEITVNPSSLDLVIPAGGSSQSGTATVTESNTTGTTSVTINGDTNIFSASLSNGTLTVTYSGTATQANPDQATIILTNGTAAATVTVTGYKEPLTVTISPADGHTFQGSTVTGIIESNVAGATIEYSFDGTTWQTYDANNGFTATVNTVGGTVTVYARATYNGETANAQATYTRVPQSATCTADIVFAPTSNGGNLSTWSGLQGHISEGADYVSDATVSSLITNTTYNAIRFGSSSYIGEFDFTLDLTKFETGACKLSRVVINAARYSSDTDCGLNVSTNVNTTGVTQAITADQTDFADYVFNFDGSEVTSISIANTTVGNRVYVRSISLEYSCGASVEAPVITPASGTYYEDQNVEITAETGATIYYTTDGSTPTTSSSQYNGTFEVPYVAGSSTTVNAIAVVTEHGEEIISDITSVTYDWGTPTVVINPDSHNTTASSVAVTLTGTPAGATIYYTIDGSTPSAQNGIEYDAPFSVDLNEIGDEVTVNAIAVYNGLTSEVASATYTRVEKIVNVNAPFFSPLVNHTYYGDQTLQIGCTTPNADIYYEIVEVSGTTAPGAGDVTDPTKSSTYYEGQTINMTVGNSYYVKAIAYIGNYVSTIAEGWYTIKSSNDWQQPSASNATIIVNSCKEFNELSSSYSGDKVIFANPVQVVYHSTYVNNGTSAEFCYVRDNTDYACVYFGKADTHNYHIFKMGDWISGGTIEGILNIYEHNYHNQLGTNTHSINATLWPSEALGWSEIIPETTTCTEIASGVPASGQNQWGHYVHVRYSTLSGVHDETGYQATGNYDMKHTGSIQDQTTSALNYYDKFYLWSAGTCRYNNTIYTINDKGDYDQDFFDTKQNAGATFDVYGVVDWYGTDGVGTFQVCPIDFLWAYKPVMTPATTTSTEPVTVDITATQPEWAAEGVVIYYKTEDMEEWAEYTGPILVSATTTIQAYAEIPAEKTDGTNYNDMVRSEIVTETYTIQGIDDPVISPESQLIDITDGAQTLPVTVTTGAGCISTDGVYYTVYTTDGTTPYWNSADDYNGTIIEGVAGAQASFDVAETTTVTAITYYVVNGEVELVSNIESETYTFARSNGLEYNLLKTAPVVGNIYVIVNKAANMGLSNTQNATNRASTGVIFKPNTNKEVVYGNDDIAQFVLEQVSGNRYYFKSLTGDGGYLYVVTNDYANLMTTAAHDASGYDVATVNVGENNADVNLSYPATITFTYEGTMRTMRYFANGRTFSTYADGSLNEPVFLYGAQVTPLHVIERDYETSTTEQVTVSDRLIGVWAAKNILWAKDQNYASIDATYKRDNQLDYVRMAKLKSTDKAFQQEEWEQSNWVMLDFSDIITETNKPEDYVGHEFANNSVIGYYVDDLNYRIKLVQSPTKVNAEPMDGYPGFIADPIDETDTYILNHYVSSNFYEPNLNWGGYTGYWFEDEYNGHSIDTCLFFMNPKIQEIAQVWAVWNKDLRQFTIYEREGYSINGYNLDGAFTMTDDQWQYNHRETTSGISTDEAYGSVESELQDDAYYMFHVAIMRSDYNYGHRKSNSQPSGKRNASALDSNATSNSIKVYPLDLTTEEAQDPPTKVIELLDVTTKTVDSVRYYNILGQASETPFEGINIVVTRYTDGSMTSRKVLR